MKSKMICAAIAAPGLGLAIALAHSGVQAQDSQAPKPGLSMKEEAPATGSNIRRRAVQGGGLPYDKAYAELTPDQQNSFKALYVEMGEGDEPPFPAEGLGPLYRAIYKASEKARVGLGKLEMDVFVDASGTPTKVDVIQSPDPTLSKYAGMIAMLTKFKPAICKGSPCAMGFPININFVRR